MSNKKREKHSDPSPVAPMFLPQSLEERRNKVQATKRLRPSREHWGNRGFSPVLLRVLLSLCGQPVSLQDPEDAGGWPIPTGGAVTGTDVEKELSQQDSP